MKTALLCLSLLVCSCALHAQTDIQFSVANATNTSDVPQDILEALDLKVKNILARNNASASSQYNVFVIEPALEVGEPMASEGLMQDFTLIKGELTLLARNKVDGTLYHSTTIDVKGAAQGNEKAALKEMIKSIAVTNPAFTRFIRITRQKIEEYYAENCTAILQKAQGLYDMRKYQEAVSYLSAVSESTPCYEAAAPLLKEIIQYIPEADTVIVQKVIERPVEVERVVEVPVVVEKIVEVPVVVEKIVEVPQAEQTPDYEITISVNDLNFKVIRCVGNKTQQRITILAEIENLDTSFNSSLYTEILSAITNNGVTCKDTEGNGSMKLPPRVKVRKEYYITKVFDEFPYFSYLEIKVGSARVYIRNLPIEW